MNTPIGGLDLPDDKKEARRVVRAARREWRAAGRHRIDGEALAAARAVLARGGAVGVFPEGTRGSGQVEQAEQGAAVAGGVRVHQLALELAQRLFAALFIIWHRESTFLAIFGGMIQPDRV